MRFFFILLLISLHVSADVSINEAWQLMQKSNPALQSLSIEKTKAKKLQNAAKSMYLPEINLSGSYTHLDKPIELDISD
ncbi:MAG: TolC family protein, partial [Campylobacterota bacterium]|nr:TolC family protein [Campylobacterota bacterium]